MKIFTRISLGLLILIVLAIAGVWIFLLTKKPVYSGNVSSPSLHDTVNVYFDDFGVPHIYGNNEEDVFHALGYVHAQDRLFQMELIRRVGAGRLSEIFGSPLIDVDKFFRMLGLAQHSDLSAREFSKQQDQPFYKNAVAYLAGINQYIESGKTPIEFSLLGIPKNKFTLTDMFLIVDYMSFNFQMAFRTDPLLTRIAQQTGAEYLRDLALGYVPGTLRVPADNSKDYPPETTPRLCMAVDIFEQLPVQPWTGSNCWVLAPSKTKNGKVLFANDTHIAYQQPCVWYEAHLECPGLNVYGSFLAGFPFPAIAHTLRHAWGLTILENDDLDFFEEKSDSMNSNRYFYKGEWKNMELRKETIHVKDSGDLAFTCRSTVHGPVCTDAIHDFADVTKSPVSASWTLLQFPSNLCEVTYRLMKSATMTDFRESISLIATPGLNVIYGDSSGNIAWWSAAKLVKRPDHVEPRLLLDGSSGNDDWLGYYDFAQNPYSINPESGYLYSCNSTPESPDWVSIPGYYLPEDRAKVVTAFLGQDRKFTLDDMKALHQNVTSVTSSELAKYIVAQLAGGAGAKSENAKKALDILQSWNGSMDTGDVAPVIFYKLEYEILKNTMADEIGMKNFFQFQQTHVEKNSITPLLMNDSSVWYDDVNTKDRKETRAAIFEQSFDSALASLELQLGKDITSWKWGQVHLLEHAHPIGRQKPFDKFFNVGPFPAPGGNETVNNSGFDFTPEGIYRAKFGPALRRALDFSDPEHGQSILPTGQSGNPMSAHYDDQAVMYVQGKTRTEWMAREDVIRISRNHLVLTKK